MKRRTARVIMAILIMATTIPHDAGAGEVETWNLPYRSGEPTMGVTADGAVYVYPARIPGERESLQTLRLSAGGSSWDPVGPSVAGIPTNYQTSDPILYVDETTGRVFVSDLVLGSFFPPVSCTRLSFSDDGGANWVTNLVACGGLENDHQTVFAGPPAPDFLPLAHYPNVVYLCVNEFGRETSCARSLDGGLTFTRTLANPFIEGCEYPGPRRQGGGATGHGVVANDGTVYLPRGDCGQPWVAVSRDGGDSWQRVRVADTEMALDARNQFQHEAAVAVDADGNVYYSWVARDRFPYVAVSGDGGRTWGPPQRVGPPDLTEANVPTIAAVGSGRIAIAFMGSTNSPGPPFPEAICDFTGPCPDPAAYADVAWRGYLVTSVDALQPAPDFRSYEIGETPLIMGTCGPGRCKALLDFFDVTIDAYGNPWVALVDGCAVGTCEDFEGNLLVATVNDGDGLR